MALNWIGEYVMKHKKLLAVILIVVILAAGTGVYLFRAQTVFSMVGVRQDEITSVDFYQFGVEVDGHYILTTVVTDKAELANILNIFGKLRVRRNEFLLGMQGGYTRSVTLYAGTRELAQFFYEVTTCSYGMWAYKVVRNISPDEQALLMSYFTKTVQQ